tara:strand:- start:166 stop:372 length:207 start_codon:yes stop_codon:yes gene_type:complete
MVQQVLQEDQEDQVVELVVMVVGFQQHLVLTENLQVVLDIMLVVAVEDQDLHQTRQQHQEDLVVVEMQ